MTSYDVQTAAMGDRAATEEAPSALVGSLGTPNPAWERIAHVYERFLEMPVGVVLTLVWLAGAAFLGSCALVLYAVGSVLLRSIA